jgi:anti-sigma B factor antagonist
MSLEVVIISEANNCKRISISGELDSRTALDLQRRIDVEIDASVATTIIDFKGLNFLSSAGLRVIFKTKKVMDDINGEFLMVNLQPQIKKVFEIIKAMEGMNIFNSQEEMDDYLASMQDKVKKLTDHDDRYY